MICPRESECIRAANSGRISPEVAGHLKQCAACAEAVRIADALNSTTTHALIEPADARILWLLAAERRYSVAEQRLARVTRSIPLIAGIVVIIAAVVRALLSGSSPVDGLLGAGAKVGPVFLIALVFVIVVVWTAPGRRART
jgi:hypothetical protein